MAGKTHEEVLDDMLDFGISLPVAQIVAPLMVRLFNDPSGFRAAVEDEAPGIAARVGLVTLH